VDPRFTRTSAVVDQHVPIRAGSDVAFLGGIIRYIIEHDRALLDYVVPYTNAASIVGEQYLDTEVLDGCSRASIPTPARTIPRPARACTADTPNSPVPVSPEARRLEAGSRSVAPVHMFWRQPGATLVVCRASRSRTSPTRCMPRCGVAPPTQGCRCRSTCGCGSSRMPTRQPWTRCSIGLEGVTAATFPSMRPSPPSELTATQSDRRRRKHPRHRTGR
jgi:formate dehydrogenase major subunit